jgi:Rod binding domain-containing protein
MAVLLPGMILAPNAPATHPAPDPKLLKAAHEFEAQLMKELLRPLTQSGGWTGDGEENEAGGTGTLGEFAAESLAGSLSAHGGLGIANRIVEEISRSGNQSPKPPVTGSQQNDTVINLRK